MRDGYGGYAFMGNSDAKIRAKIQVYREFAQNRMVDVEHLHLGTVYLLKRTVGDRTAAFRGQGVADFAKARRVVAFQGGTDVQLVVVLLRLRKLDDLKAFQNPVQLIFREYRGRGGGFCASDFFSR